VNNSYEAIVRSLLSAAALGAATSFVAGCGASLPSGSTPNGAAADTVRPSVVFKFKTLNNNNDPTFNQLLGINTGGVISGYFGSGTAGHPNKGYTIVPPYGQNNYTNENYPGSAQTQVVAINNLGDTAGFWVDGKGVNRGFVEWQGVFTSYRDPKTGKGTVNQILGLNDSGIAVGFYTDGTGVNHGFMLNQATGKFTPVNPPGATNVTASGINNHGNITGFYVSSSQTVGFFMKGKQFSAFSYPNATSTMPFGVNDKDHIVGGYVDSGGKMHGFSLLSPLVHAKWTSIDDPNGVGTTTINGISNQGKMVGFYVDGAGNTDGMLITP
jgi:hypothetical protein